MKLEVFNLYRKNFEKDMSNVLVLDVNSKEYEVQFCGHEKGTIDHLIRVKFVEQSSDIVYAGKHLVNPSESELNNAISEAYLCDQTMVYVHNGPDTLPNKEFLRENCKVTPTGQIIRLVVNNVKKSA